MQGSLHRRPPLHNATRDPAAQRQFVVRGIGLVCGCLTIILEGLAVLDHLVLAQLSLTSTLAIAVIGLLFGVCVFLLWLRSVSDVLPRVPALPEPSQPVRQLYGGPAMPAQPPGQHPVPLPSVPGLVIPQQGIRPTSAAFPPISEPLPQEDERTLRRFPRSQFASVGAQEPSPSVPLPRFPPPVLTNYVAYSVPREGLNMANSADRYNRNATGTRYAIADGVGTSFLPAHWAEILVDHFVERSDDFAGQEDFVQWLGRCSQLWHEWVNNEWLPVAREKSGQEDWSRDVQRGASSTFAGCSFSRQELEQHGRTAIHVTVVGDAEFFLVSPPMQPGQRWTHRTYFLQHPQEFSQAAQTLASPPRRVERDWKRVHYSKDDFIGTLDDYIVLATDALALWILQQPDPWSELFSLRDASDFQSFVKAHRDRGVLDVDDTTLVVIPLKEKIQAENARR